MSLVKYAREYLAALTLSCIVMFGGQAKACMVCIPFPKETATDQLLRADVVVLARENPEVPFSFVAVNVLKGDLEEPEIDLFVDSTKRRRLALNPEHSVVLTYDSVTDHWKSAGYATAEYQELVVKILALAPGWNRSGHAENRATFFLPYLAETDRALRELAYLEVGRSSYDTIRRADTIVPDEQLHRFIADPMYIEWHALYILLLGVDAKPNEAEMIRATMQRIAKYDQTLNLSAWATALVEVDGEKAVDWLEEVYFSAADRTPDTVLEVIKALSVHGARKQSGLRGHIAKSYDVLIRTHPSLAGWAARDLTAWSDWRFVDTFAELRRSQQTTDSATAYAIDYYIGRSRSSISN